jgi:hypothetical protein
MKKIILSTFLALSISNVAYSEGFNYDYIQVGIGTTNSKHYDREYYVGISKPINNNISVRGNLYYLYGDWNDPGEYEELSVNAYSLEGIYHKEVTPSTDFLASVGYARSHFKITCTPTTGTCGTYSNPTEEFGHHIASVGVKHKTENNIEIEGSYSAVRTSWTSGATNTERQSKISLMKEVFDKTSIGVERLNSKAKNHYGLFARKYF